MAGYCPIDGDLLLEAPSLVVVATSDSSPAILAGENDGAVISVVAYFPDACWGPDAGLVAVGIVDGGKISSSGNICILVELVGFVGEGFLQFPGGFAVADVVVSVAEASSQADPVFNQLAAAVVGKIPYCDRCPRIPGIPLLDGTYQGVVLVFMAGRQFAVRPLSVTDGGYEVEPGMVGIAADHAVRVVEVLEEAAIFVTMGMQNQSWVEVYNL